MLKFFAAIGLAISLLFALILTVLLWFFLTTPRPSNIRDCLTTEMFHVRLCPTDPNYTRLSAISPYLREAVIASEDGAFYSHHGFDWFELKESFEKNMEQKEFARGGSTITQQLAKNVYLSQEKSVLRKLREALIVVQLEQKLSKDEILEKYLNVVEFAPNTYGASAGAKYYFQKSAKDLDPVEASFMAFLLPNPKKYSSSYHKHQLTRFASSQVRIILERLWKQKKLDEATYQQSLQELDGLFHPESTEKTESKSDVESPSLDSEHPSDENKDMDAPPLEEPPSP